MPSEVKDHILRFVGADAVLSLCHAVPHFKPVSATLFAASTQARQPRFDVDALWPSLRTPPPSWFASFSLTETAANRVQPAILDLLSLLIRIHGTNKDSSLAVTSSSSSSANAPADPQDLAHAIQLKCMLPHKVSVTVPRYKIVSETWQEDVALLAHLQPCLGVLEIFLPRDEWPEVEEYVAQMLESAKRIESIRVDCTAQSTAFDALTRVKGLRSLLCEDWPEGGLNNMLDLQCAILWIEWYKYEWAVAGRVEECVERWFSSMPQNVTEFAICGDVGEGLSFYQRKFMKDLEARDARLNELGWRMDGVVSESFVKEHMTMLFTEQEQEYTVLTDLVRVARYSHVKLISNQFSRDQPGLTDWLRDKCNPLSFDLESNELSAPFFRDLDALPVKQAPRFDGRVSTPHRDRPAPAQVDTSARPRITSQRDELSPLDSLAQLGNLFANAIQTRERDATLPRYSSLREAPIERERTLPPRSVSSSERVGALLFLSWIDEGGDPATDTKARNQQSPLYNSAALSSTKFNAVGQPKYAGGGSSATVSSSSNSTKISAVFTKTPYRGYGALDSPSLVVPTSHLTAPTPSSRSIILSPHSQRTTKSFLVEIPDDEDGEDERVQRKPPPFTTLSSKAEGKRKKGSESANLEELKGSIQSVHGVFANVMDKVMNRGGNLKEMSKSAHKLEDVGKIFRRNGQVAETEAWVQKVKTAGFAELLFFIAVIVTSGLAFLLFLMFIERLLFTPGAIPPTTPLPPTTPGSGNGTPLPQQPPPYCVPYPGTPPPTAPPITPPAPPNNGAGNVAISPAVIQAMNVFIFMAVMVYIGRRIGRRPKRPRRRGSHDVLMQEEDEEED
ncbi:hypothetical protein BC830DRAFT_1083730 [Chytriomyces sp. MP71]|nr:hypothetical protein BC830DRAFT_1083730 [Chytriomyces sp. MP71]